MLRLSPDSLDYALTHIVARGDTDILPAAQEFNAIFARWHETRDYLASIDIDTWAVRPLRAFLSPKRGLAFRIGTQLDPFDTLLLTALIYEIGEDLESRRVPLGDQIVHSYRFSPTSTGQMYRPETNFDSFRTRSLTFAKEQGGFVLMTDIADFFHRLYHHRLENALHACTAKRDHVRGVTKLLSAWNQSDSHGVPVGPAAVRLLAEVAIDDVDRALLSEGFLFCRFSDDYRIFVQSEGEARKACAFLASTLFRHHGLTLQESKTEILEAGQFISRFERTEEDEERRYVSERFDELVEQLQEKLNKDVEPIYVSEDGKVVFSFAVDLYGVVDYEDLESDQKALVDSLNLWQIVRTQIAEIDSFNLPLLRFVLRRITQLKLEGDWRLLLSDMKRTYPLFPEIVEAVAMHGDVEPELQAEIGGRLLELLDDEVVGHLEYHRVWILSVLARPGGWNHATRLVQLYNTYSDQMTRPGLVAALAERDADHWFRGKRADVTSLPPWERRAFLAGVRCLQKDEAKHWLRSITPQLDRLDSLVAQWAADRLS